MEQQSLTKTLENFTVRSWIYIVLVVFITALIALVVAGIAVNETSEAGKHYAATATSVTSISVTEIRIDIGEARLEFFFNYFLKPADGQLTRVLLRGPRFADDGTILIDPITGLAPIALTLCGGETTCQALESTTCIKQGHPATCGEVAAKLTKLDTVTPDVPVNPHPRQAFSSLMKMLKSRPQTFYYTVESSSGPVQSTSTLGTAYLL
jgi:hypothetical protein